VSFPFLGCEEEVRTLGINLFHSTLKCIKRQLSGNDDIITNNLTVNDSWDDIIASYSFRSTINIGSTSNLLFRMHQFDFFFLFIILFFTYDNFLQDRCKTLELDGRGRVER